MNIFHYRDIDSFLHNQHPLTKIFLTLLISSVILKSSMLFSMIIFALLSFTLVVIKVPLKRYIKQGIYFPILLLIIGVSHYLSSLNISSTVHITISFMSMIMMSILLIDSTAFNDIAGAIGSLFSHVSRKKGYYIASTIELTLHMIPLFFDISHELMIARKARGIRFLSSPVKNVSEYVAALFSLTLNKVEHLEIALKSRNYNPEQKREFRKMNIRDITLLILASLFVVLVYFIT